MTREEQLFLNRAEELARRALEKGVYTRTGFLSLREQELLSMLGHSLCACTLFGGAEDCERKMARFGSAELCGYEEPFPIACVEIAPAGERFADALTHRDFLGALMSLGVERDVLGDVLVRGKHGYVFCTEAIAPFLAENLTKVKHTAVRCAVCEPPAPAQTPLSPETVKVTSPRADAVVARAYRLSREESLALFRAGRVFRNGAVLENNSAPLRDGDILSVRGFGRFACRGVTGTTKKGKLNLTIEKYLS